jgi:hypothetical protein
MALVRGLFAIGPLLFGLCFLAPLVAQSLEALQWTPPLGMSNLALGLAVGGTLGLVATVRGRWV